jgi:hypothetical protein
MGELIAAVPGYPEDGAYTWRAADDAAFVAACDDYNRRHGLRPGDPGYWTAARLKAQAMIESGGDRAEFLSDPLQVNVPGDWVPEKATICGLRPGQPMTPAISAAAALVWMRFKGWTHDESGAERNFRGLHETLRRYNGNARRGRGGIEHREWYARRVATLETAMAT